MRVAIAVSYSRGTSGSADQRSETGHDNTTDTDSAFGRPSLHLPRTHQQCDGGCVTGAQGSIQDGRRHIQAPPGPRAHWQGQRLGRQRCEASARRGHGLHRQVGARLSARAMVVPALQHHAVQTESLEILRELAWNPECGGTLLNRYFWFKRLARQHAATMRVSSNKRFNCSNRPHHSLAISRSACCTRGSVTLLRPRRSDSRRYGRRQPAAARVPQARCRSRCLACT